MRLRDTYKVFKNRLRFFELFNFWVFRHVTGKIIKVLKYNNSKTILDVCCGSGNLSGIMIKNGFDVTGVDMPETMIDKAKKEEASKELSSQRYC